MSAVLATFVANSDSASRVYTCVIHGYTTGVVTFCVVLAKQLRWLAVQSRQSDERVIEKPHKI